MAKRITITGTSYDITAWQLDDGSWAVEGHYGDVDIDSIWCGFELPTFEDADASILDIINDCR